LIQLSFNNLLAQKKKCSAADFSNLRVTALSGFRGCYLGIRYHWMTRLANQNQVFHKVM